MLREHVWFPIKAAAFPDKDWGIAAWLSVPPGAADILLILIHGGVYTHAYWDMPYKPEVYSMVQWAYEQKLPTLNIDRLGNGESSHPPGKALTMALNAESVDQVISNIRETGLRGRTFSKIVTVGHSLGSLTAGLTQATYGSADAVVLTGVTGVNVTNVSDDPETAKERLSPDQPARLEPHLADRHHLYDDDYFSRYEKERTRMFFKVPPVEQEIIKLDVELQGTWTTGEYETAGVAFDAIERITCPVLVELSRYDAIFYDPQVEEDCARAYALAVEKSPPNFTVGPLFAEANHSLAQHPNARETYDVMLNWLEQLGFV